MTTHLPLDPPLPGVAPGFNYVGSQGFVYEATAVEEAIGQGLTEHPELPLSETLAMARVFDEIRAQIGLKYPWTRRRKPARRELLQVAGSAAPAPV